jgi:lipopolysaccharide export system protein LptC
LLMPEFIATERTPLQRWALPRGRHDFVIKAMRLLLPIGIAALAIGLVSAPLLRRAEVSFVLAKDNVAIAKERMRVTKALYRGEDGKGQAFSLSAGSAVQVNSKDPVVRLKELSARIQLKDGPATIDATAGRYDMDREVVNIEGPVQFSAASGYRLSTENVAIGLKTRRMVSGGSVSGQMPLGSFGAGRISADLGERSVVLDGRAHLHIVQGGIR